MTAIRRRLIEALKAIAKARPRIGFRMAFRFLSRYVPGSKPRRDEELDKAFKEADDAISGKRGKSAKSDPES